MCELYYAEIYTYAHLALGIVKARQTIQLKKSYYPNRVFINNTFIYINLLNNNTYSKITDCFAREKFYFFFNCADMIKISNL